MVREPAGTDPGNGPGSGGTDPGNGPGTGGTDPGTGSGTGNPGTTRNVGKAGERPNGTSSVAEHAARTTLRTKAAKAAGRAPALKVTAAPKGIAAPKAVAARAAAKAPAIRATTATWAELVKP
jgi:hypothetical protein